MNKKYLYTISFLIANGMWAMERSTPILRATKSDMQHEAATQLASVSTPKTLFQHFGIPSNTVSDIQKLLVAHIVGPGGWYYKHMQLKHQDGITDIAFNAQGTALATASGPIARVWNMHGGDCVKVCDHDDTRVDRVLFHPEKNALVTLARNASGYCWDLHGNIEPDCFTFDKRFIPYHGYNIHLHLNWPMLIRTLDDAEHSICIGNMNNHKIVTFSPHIGYIRDIRLHPREDVLAATDSEAVVLWCLKNKKKLCSIAHDGIVVTNVKFHPKEKLFAIATYSDVSVRDFNGALLATYTFAQPWAYEDGIVLDRPTLSQHWSAVSVMLHPQQKLLVAIKGRNNSAILWNFENEGDGQARELMHANGPLVAAFNPQGTVLAIAADIEKDCKIYLRNCKGDLVRTMCHGGGISPSLVYATESMFATKAYEPGKQHGGNVYVWQKHENPTLKQVLLRLVLYQYYKECDKKNEKPQICATHDLIPEWMAQKFFLKKDELVLTWHTMPESLRKSIFNTLVFRAKNREANSNAAFRAKFVETCSTALNKVTDCTIC